MKVGTVEAKEGSKAFGSLDVLETLARFRVRVPLHIVEGAANGPVLLVQAGVSGLEVEPAVVLTRLVDEIDPAKVAGTLIVVPLLNTSGFELERTEAVWDSKNLNRLGRGKAEGTVSERLVHAYYQQLISNVDALIDLRTGGLWGYFRYAGVYDQRTAGDAKELALALGLPQVLLGQPDDRSMAYEASRDGKTVVSTWIGGGVGLVPYREDDMERVRRAVLNAMGHLGMLQVHGVWQGERTTIISAHTVLRATGERGLTFMDKRKRGTIVEAGEALGYIKHPYTGDIIRRIRAPRAGVVVHAGASWPIPPDGAILAILGDLVDEVGEETEQGGRPLLSTSDLGGCSRKGTYRPAQTVPASGQGKQTVLHALAWCKAGANSEV